MKPIDGNTTAQTRDWLAIVLDCGIIYTPRGDPNSLDN